MLLSFLKNQFPKEDFKYFNPATKYIHLMRYMYILALPLVNILIFFNIKPNLITTISNIITVTAILALFYLNNPLFFIILWVLAEIFDVCDGTVARKTNCLSPNGGFYDSFSDRIKLFLIFIAIGYYYNEYLIWIVASFASSVMLLSSFSNEILKHNKDMLENYPKSTSRPIQEQQGKGQDPIYYQNSIGKLLKNFLETFPILNSCFLFIKNNFFVVHGQTMILLSLMSLNSKVAIVIMMIFILGVIKSLITTVNNIVITNRLLFNMKPLIKP